ncbi:TP53-binding protein 1 [Galendromus occidentalis]|uniref:TP53-binding protein 1 n=1 Tax=Galendromus occidentalis TaxID=34638 RepID=A0AAJ7SD28_9ACAR|nr:TP53-binding protein 1 [Galendromus occidentalis]
MDFSLNYPLYLGSFLQAPTARAVETESITDSVPSSGNLLECPPVLDESWRNVGFSEPFEATKRQASQCSPSAGSIQGSSGKRARLDGSSFNGSDSLLFKSSLEGKLAKKLRGTELLGGISESFDFASTPDPPDDNSNLAQSISLIQETLDQSIAQGDDRACEQVNSLPSRPISQSTDRAVESRLFGTDAEIPSGNIQAQSTPLESIIYNGNGPAQPRESPRLGSSSFSSLPSTTSNRPISMKEYRLVFTEQVFERNGEIIRRQMIQKEHSLERSRRLTQEEFENMLRVLQAPLCSQTSDNFADISSSQATSREPSTENRKSVEKVVQAGDRNEKTSLIAEETSGLEVPLKVAGKNTSPRGSLSDAPDRHPRRFSTEPTKQNDESIVDTTSKAHGESSDPEPEFKEPKLGKDERHSPEKKQPEGAIVPPCDPARTISSANESTELADPTSNSRLVIGSPCLAQWSDNLYYMATVIKSSRNGRYGVKFADGTQESVKGDLLFPLKAELESGQPVYVKVRNVFEYAVIKDKTTVSQRPGYAAELHTKRVVRVTKDKIVFTQEMVDVLKEKQSKTISSREIARVRESTDASEFETSGKTRVKRPQAIGLDVTSSEGVASDTTAVIRPSKRSSKMENPSVIASESGGGASGSSLNPPTLVFEGMGFLLTDTERAVKNNKSSSTSSFESGSSLGETVEFNKEQLQNLIEENGGVVFKSFTEAECADSLDTGIAERYLLSRSHMKTLKYVLCLAAGIRCLGHQIVHAALREGRMPEPAKYQLPAGISLMQKVPIEQPSAHRLIFKDMTIAVVAEKNEFVNTWSQVIIAAGGRIASKLPQRQSPQRKTASNSNGTDGVIRFMVTTPECSSLTLRSARALRIAPVSSEWVVQSIIHARVLEPDTHEAFAYDYKKTE